MTATRVTNLILIGRNPMKLIQRVFELSDVTTVHFKDFSRRPEGALAFVETLLTALEGLDETTRLAPRD